MGLEAENYHEAEYLLPRLVIQVFFERLSLYWQVESSPWSVIHTLGPPALAWLRSGISVPLFLWAAEAPAVRNAEYF